MAVDEANQSMLASGVKALSPLPPGAAVFISGVKPFFNPFTTGNALRIAFKDSGLVVEVEKPDAELIAKFCETAGAKRFLQVVGTLATDITAEVAGRCGERYRR
jgi:hypothetical protein